MLTLNFHGIRVGISSQDEEVLSQLARDFSYFMAAPPGDEEHPDIHLELRKSPVPKDKTFVRSFLRWRSARIAHKDGLRLAHYDGGALLEYDLARERGLLHGENPALLHELSYLTVLSRVGDRLDRKGQHRVHALGFTFQGKGGLLLLPMEGGKSRLGLELIGRPEFGIFSDDIPLLSGDGRTLSPFPLRLGLRGTDWRGIDPRFVRPFHRRRFGVKHLVDVDFFREKISPEAPLAWVLVGSRDGGRKAPRIEPCPKARAGAAMLSHLILGVGTPQILELMLPPPPFVGGALALAAIAAKRASCAFAAVSRAACGRFDLSDDPKSNADALERFLKG